MFSNTWGIGTGTGNRNSMDCIESIITRNRSDSNMLTDQDIYESI